MEQIFHGQFSLHDAAIFGCKYIKNTTWSQTNRWQSGSKWYFNILTAKKVLKKMPLSLDIPHGM